MNLSSLYTRQKKQPTHICVTCHSVSNGATISSDSRTISAILGFVVLFGRFLFGLIGVLFGVMPSVGGAIVGAITGRPKFICPLCNSADIIPLGTPRANALIGK